MTSLSSSYNISGLVPACWLLFQCFPGPERSGDIVFIQHRISDFKQCPFSANTVDGPVANQCIWSVSSVYPIQLLQSCRDTEGKRAVVRQCKASIGPVYNQCAISMSEIFK